MKRCVVGSIMRSSSATRNQPAVPSRAVCRPAQYAGRRRSAAGRRQVWPARRRVHAAQRPCAKASSGSQIRPCHRVPASALRMRRAAIEHIRHRLALVGRQRRDIDQRLVPALSGRGDHRAGIGMSDEYHWAAANRSSVRSSAATSSLKRGQRQWRCRPTVKPSAASGRIIFAPARTISPCTMGEHNVTSFLDIGSP